MSRTISIPSVFPGELPDLTSGAVVDPIEPVTVTTVAGIRVCSDPLMPRNLLRIIGQEHLVLHLEDDDHSS